jgi:hypothetical protein
MAHLMRCFFDSALLIWMLAPILHKLFPFNVFFERVGYLHDRDQEQAGIIRHGHDSGHHHLLHVFCGHAYGRDGTGSGTARPVTSATVIFYRGAAGAMPILQQNIAIGTG